MKIKDKRLHSDRIFWFATAKPTGQPHIVPVWFIYDNELIYVFTQCKSIKARNLRKNPAVALSLGTGNNPFVIEGTIEFITTPYPQAIIDQFIHKYDLTNVTENGMIYREINYNCLLEIRPNKLVMGE